MKTSKYNIVIDNDGEYVVYNTKNDKMMLCNPETMDLLKEHRTRIDALEQIHPSLYRYMQNKQCKRRKRENKGN